jgi:hypothetical protein
VVVRHVRGEAVYQIESLEDEFAQDAGAGSGKGATVVLAVGDTKVWSAAGRRMPTGGRVVFADFHLVSRELLEELVPHLVVSPILARNFDCVDLAQRLALYQFAGRYRAFGPRLPNPQIITREIRSLVPGLDFDVLPMD